MRIRAKIGSMPASVVMVLRKRTPPKIGDRLKVRSRNEDQTESVRCYDLAMVGGEPLYFLERF